MSKNRNTVFSLVLHSRRAAAFKVAARLQGACGNVVDIAASIILGSSKLIIVPTPLAIIIGIPAWRVWRTVRRRLPKQPEPVAES